MNVVPSYESWLLRPVGLHCDACGEPLCVEELVEFLGLRDTPAEREMDLTQVREAARTRDGKHWRSLLCTACADGLAKRFAS